MWKFQHSIDASASAEVIFAIMADVGAWPEWNPGVERMELNGTFASGTTGTMVVPGQDPFATRLVWVEAGVGFEDETTVPDAGVVVRVRHDLEPLSGGGTRITYAATIDGPAADTVGPSIGPEITSDFPEVMAALAARAQAAVAAP
jgi:polyketide cyclase/dehydrase/lipid transport protein